MAPPHRQTKSAACALITSAVFGMKSSFTLLIHRRRTVRMEGLDGLQAPGLPLSALGLGPGHGRPVGPQHQPRAGIGDFDAVARRLIDIEEEGLLDRMLVRPGLDEDAVLEEDVGGAK